VPWHFYIRNQKRVSNSFLPLSSSSSRTQSRDGKGRRDRLVGTRPGTGRETSGLQGGPSRQGTIGLPPHLASARPKAIPRSRDRGRAAAEASAVRRCRATRVGRGLTDDGTPSRSAFARSAEQQPQQNAAAAWRARPWHCARRTEASEDETGPSGRERRGDAPRLLLFPHRVERQGRGEVEGQLSAMACSRSGRQTREGTRRP